MKFTEQWLTDKEAECVEKKMNKTGGSLVLIKSPFNPYATGEVMGLKPGEKRLYRCEIDETLYATIQAEHDGHFPPEYLEP
jgi:hypothetical protein